ncbi:MAG: hypothetical protein GY719_39185 [bacterium]|nr:hypothetical protein [bacterium]
MSDADSNAATDDHPAPDFEVPRLEVLFDSFEDFLEQAAADLAAAKFEIRPKEDLGDGDLAHLEIGLRERPALIRALGRVVETPGDADGGNGSATTRLSLTWVDPASDGLIASIRRWYPPVAGAETPAADTGPSAFDSAEWDVDFDALDDQEPDMPLPAVDDDDGDLEEVMEPEAEIEPQGETAPEAEVEEEAAVEAEDEAAPKPEEPEPRDAEDAFERLDAAHPQRHASPETATDPFSFNEDNLYDSKLRPPEEVDTGSFPLRQEPWRAPHPGAVAERELRPPGGTTASRPSALAFGESVALKTDSPKRSRRWLAIVAVLAIAAIVAGAWWSLRDRPRPASGSAAARSAQPGPAAAPPHVPVSIEPAPTASPPETATTGAPAAGEPASGDEQPAVTPPTTDSVPAEPAEVVDIAAEVESALRAWALAWSEKRVDDFIGCYTPDYSPADLDRETWMRQRRSRISAPATIEVGVSQVEVEVLDDSSAVARFFQTYVAKSKRRTTWKTFELVRGEDGWKIRKEATGK